MAVNQDSDLHDVDRVSHDTVARTEMRDITADFNNDSSEIAT